MKKITWILLLGVLLSTMSCLSIRWESDGEEGYLLFSEKENRESKEDKEAD